MAFDQGTRNRLAGLVGAARAKLVQEFTRQLQSDYGLDPATGAAADLDTLRHLDDSDRETALILRETWRHYLAAAPRDARTGRDVKAQRDALDRIVREQAFTVLNRLCALRMAEARGLLIESVGRGHDSRGFALYRQVAGAALGETGDAYRAYLFSVFDEFAVDLPALFDRYSPQGRLFPRDTVLRELLALLNAPDIEPLWAEDETIGWVYQYFNSVEERRQMRAESAAPRNSRELAVRNQFFTPRYVVEFLTDNTLGRIWYEMTRGQTALVDTCRYLVRRPLEIFLNGDDFHLAESGREWLGRVMAGDWAALADDPTESELAAVALLIDGYDEAPRAGIADLLAWAGERVAAFEHSGVLPASRPLRSLELWLMLFALQRQWRNITGSGPAGEAFLSLWRRVYHELKAALLAEPADLSQEELLRRPVFVPHRPPKDPRDIKLLDPACGSMHFGLYAFDLFERIYDEAWAIEAARGPRALARPVGLAPLTETYADEAAFRRDVPRLILAHNLHGIDIDPRAVQIAGLSLWLRAQRSWRDQGVAAAERPAITRAHVVCAEPMPGEREMLDAFVRDLPHRVVGELMVQVFDEMKLAGEAGALLKIEATLRGAIDVARTRYNTELLRRRQDAGYLPGLAPERGATLLDLMELPDPERFWETAEEQVLAALRDFAAATAEEGSYQRHLFAEDTARGLAFIDLCRERYDVVVMNPPFGTPTNRTKTALQDALREYGNDIYPLFVLRGLALTASQGKSRCYYQSHRLLCCYSREMERTCPIEYLSSRGFFVDLGFGVLDALVETAAYVVKNQDDVQVSSFHRATTSENKDSSIQFWLMRWREGEVEENSYLQQLANFKALPSLRIAFWMPSSIIDIFRRFRRYGALRGGVQVGLQTSDNFRFLRLAWEVPPLSVGNQYRQTLEGAKQWILYAKGGEYAPYYSDIHLAVNWGHNGREVKNFSDNNGNIISYPRNEQYYFKPGLTYSERTTSNFSARILAAGCCFDTKGPRISANNSRDHLVDLCVFMTRVTAFLLEFMVGSADVVFSGSAARDYTPRVIAELPMPNLSEMVQTELANIGHGLWALHKQEQDVLETDRYFSSPFHLLGRVSSLDSYFQAEESERDKRILQILELTWTAERHASEGYGLEGDVISAIEKDFGRHPCQYLEREISQPEFREAYLSPIDTLVDLVTADAGYNRTFSKKSFYADRRIELLSHKFRTHPKSILGARSVANVIERERVEERVNAILSYGIGAVFGRWNLAISNEPSPLDNTDPFAPLPVCPPGMLQNDLGLPAAPADLPDDYPLRISWPGILVDDEGHPEDVAGRVRQALAVIWPSGGETTADAIEAEACAILGVASLRDYFARPDRFFADHLSRYSKSRRAAPIYWPLSSANGAYTVWLYYHRLNDQTLYHVVNDFVNPKLKRAAADAARLRARGGRSRAEERELESLVDLEAELRGFREELLRVAGFWRPDLNDGVQITAAPLWRLFRHRPWQKRLRETWEKLEAGDYDWAHLAYAIWPDRVRAKCAGDKSLAIAHDLEHLYVAPPNAPRKKRRATATADEEETADVE